MEATGCRLAMTGHSTLVIVSVYLPSPKRLLRRDLKALFALRDAVILFGDFNYKNIRWGCLSNNYNGIKLDELEDRLDFGIIAPSTCSYQPRQDSGRGERAGGSGILGSPEVSARYSRIDKSKNAALRASAYPTPEYRSRARALQREVKARVREFRNESWSDLMEEIKPSHKAFWAVTKALKTEGYTLYPTQNLIIHEVQTLVKSLNTRKAPGLDGISNKAIKCFSIPLLSLLVAIFNACIKNCYFPPAWKEAEVIGIHKPGKPRDLPASYRPISLLSDLGKLFEKILKTRLSDHLLGKDLIIDEQFGFRPVHSCPQQVLRLVEYVSEGFETERSTVAVFFDVAKAFDRQTDISHLGMSALTRQDVLSEQEFLKVPPSLLYSTQTIPRPSSSGVQLALFADDTALFTEVGIGAPSPSSLQGH
ncbi:Probable RNA-directed DNA polymerase from transposon BS [Eumeta japonica]|uniref:Probable RNA-directed DNA polymerase from transposon BS n=1 Tax=Eumeta variegata TaxID=151549 RepID=A0A4C1Y1V8_EUMVA|nr:Probable RNA-directed DNA polymerase from transposon BS [Eumeta japonica]